MGAMRRWTLVAVLMGAACSDGTGAEETTTPEGLPAPPPAADPGGDPDLETAQPYFLDQEYDDIPLPEGSEQLGPVDTIDGTTTGTYTVEEVSAEDAVVALDQLLQAEGWRVLEPVRQELDAWRGDWAKDERRLEVTAYPIDSLGPDYEMQFSLVLSPNLEDNPIVP